MVFDVVWQQWALTQILIIYTNTHNFHNNKTASLDMSGMQRWGAWDKTVVRHTKWWVVSQPLNVQMCTHPVAPGSNSTHVLLTQPHPCGPMSEQCGTRFCLVPRLHHRLQSKLGKMLTAGEVCPCGPHLRRPCGQPLTINIPLFFRTNIIN